MKTSYFKISWVFFLLCICDFAFAQFGDLYNPRRSRGDQYNRYDIEKLLQSAEESGFSEDDTTGIKGQLLTTPEELRKLGVDEGTIEELIKLKTQGDSISVAKYEAERRLKEEELGEAADSFSFDEVLELIEIRKRQILEKALKLPEPTIYGHEFFRRTILNPPFGKLEEIRLRPDYELNIGDEVTVLMWGEKDFSKVYTIDELGAINPLLVGRINLKGITYEKSKEIIKERFARTYAVDKEKMEVAVSHTRIIPANFVGNLFNPGAYRFPVQTSVIDALVMIEGPNAIGSMRDIYIERNGQRVHSLDVYDFLNKPDSRQNYFLQENDYVIVPSLQNLVNISGKIRRPHNYEMKKGEGLRDLIAFAGGLDAGAFTRTISIKRYHRNKEVLLDVNLDSLIAVSQDIPLVNGDSIFVYGIPKELRNYVQVVGAVHVPGRYELRKNDRITDILIRAEGILDDADRSRAYVMRLKDDFRKQIIPFSLEDILLTEQAADNVVLQNLDTIKVISRKDFRQDFEVNVIGAVQKEGAYPFAENLTLKDLLYLAGGLKLQAANERIEISRRITFGDKNTGKKGAQQVVVKRIDIGGDLTFDSSAQDFALKPYDQIFVRFKPEFEPQSKVKIYGEVMYPGVYSLLSKEERIVSLIERAGGFTPHAFQEGTWMYRSQDSTGVILQNLEKAFRKYKKPNKRPKKLKKIEKSHFNYILADGDSIFIPEVRNIVTLTGAVGFSDVDTIPRLSVPYEGTKRADYYLRKYGAGFGRYAKKSRTFVRQANGQTKKTLNLGLVKLYPKVKNGSIVYVDVINRKKNEKIREERRENLSWNDAFDSVTAKLATVATVLLLFLQVR